MARLPEEITKGKAPTYKVVKLKNPPSYYNTKRRATTKYSHAITLCDIPIIYASFGSNYCEFQSAQIVGDNISQEKWWEGGKGWEASDFPSVNYGYPVGIAFITALDATIGSGGMPNSFWEKAFGDFKYVFHDLHDNTGDFEIDAVSEIDLFKAFALSFVYFTEELLWNVCPTYPTVEDGNEMNDEYGEPPHKIYGFREYSITNSESSHLWLLEWNTLTFHPKATKRVNNITPQKLKAWVSFINSISQDEWKHGGKRFGIVNTANFDAGGITVLEYLSSLSPKGLENFTIGSDLYGKSTVSGALKGALEWQKWKEEGKASPRLLSMDLWAGYLLSPANVIGNPEQDGTISWGRLITPQEAKEYQNMMNEE